jgi:probable HAF family extracellular repeat protein
MDNFSVWGSMQGSERRLDRTARIWAAVSKIVVGIVLVIAGQSARAQAMYRITPLGFLGGCTTAAPTAAGFNKTDAVAGTACNANGDSHAFLWKNNGNPMMDLGPPEVGSTSSSAALDSSGLVAGSASDSTGYFAFESLGNGAPMTRIYNGLGGTEIAAYGVNSSGQLTGLATLPGDSLKHAFFWKNDGSPMLDLGTSGYDDSTGTDMNESGQVAGSLFDISDPYVQPFVWKNDGTPLQALSAGDGACCINASGQVAGGGRFYAFFWDGTVMHNLGVLGNNWRSGAWALNDSGQVVGSSYPYSEAKRLAFVWLNNGTPIKNLGTFGGTSSQSLDINASGQVTGWANIPGDAAEHAFIWRNDGTKIQDLNSLIDPTDPLKPHITLTAGQFINDFGDIVADGTDSRTGLEDLYLLQGTVLTLAPRSLAFGNQAIKTSSAAKSVTMTNTSPKAVAITSITLTGTAAGQFAQTNNCGKSLAGHKICTIKVTFKPTSKGAKTETLNVNGGGGGLRVVSLTGTGV